MNDFDNDYNDTVNIPLSTFNDIMERVNFLWNYAYYSSPTRDPFIVKGLDDLANILENYNKNSCN